MKNIIFLISIGFLFLLNSCNVFNKKETIPAYVQINNISFNSEGRGNNSHNIINVWVYANEELLGIFEIPCKIPILKNGPTEIKIKAGIYMDGIKTNRTEYPFYSNYITNINLEEQLVYEIKPYFTYAENIEFPFLFYEDFEDALSNFDSLKTSSINLNLVSAGEFKTDITGENIGKALFRAGKNDATTIISKSEYDLPRGGKNVFIEFDYISTLKLGVGILSETTSEKKIDIILNPNNKWTKVYVPLMDEIGKSTTSARFKILFESVSTSSKDEYFLIDNIKLIKFKN